MNFSRKPAVPAPFVNQSSSGSNEEFQNELRMMILK